MCCSAIGLGELATVYCMNQTRVCCSLLQCVAVCCSVLQCVSVCFSVLQCVAACCSVLQCVAVCCSLQRGGCAGFRVSFVFYLRVLQYVAVCCSVLQRVAVNFDSHLPFSQVFV